MFDPNYRQKTKVKYVAAGNWGSHSNANEFLKGVVYPWYSHRNQAVIAHYTNRYAIEPDIIYEPVVYNEQFKIH